MCRDVTSENFTVVSNIDRLRVGIFAHIDQLSYQDGVRT